MLLRLALGLCLLTSWCPALAAGGVMRIAGDMGGRIGDYLDRYDAVRASGGTVAIDGACSSACTIVLGRVPRDRICVTPRARLGFHQAWDWGRAQSGAGAKVADAEATEYLFSLYPPPVQDWITRHGGLPSPNGKLLWLKGKSLARFYRRCP